MVTVVRSGTPISPTPSPAPNDAQKGSSPRTGSISAAATQPRAPVMT